MVEGIIAGGHAALYRSIEGAEDSEAAGVSALHKRRAKPPDVVCGIAASARTPFVAGAMRAARGMHTIFITTNTPRMLRSLGIIVDAAICPNVGPEVIMGSTRMKSGTAQKLVLNMMTTAAMIRLGKVYGNLMVDLQTKNEKLQERAKRIISEVTGCDYEHATATLRAAQGSVKTGIVMLAQTSPHPRRTNGCAEPAVSCVRRLRVQYTGNIRHSRFHARRSTIAPGCLMTIPAIALPSAAHWAGG